MTVGWQLLAHSERTTGIQVWVAQQHGLGVTIDRSTIWYDHSSHRILSLQDLFTAAAWPAAHEAIARAAGRHTGGPAAVRAALAAGAGPRGGGTAFGLAADGSLLVTFSAHSRSPKAKPVTVRVTPGPLKPRLSRAGRSITSAALKQRARDAASQRVDCRKLKCVALTFDDGPGPYTAELIAILQQHKAPATFFLVGDRVRQAPDLVAIVDQAGVEIGNHSNHHDELTLLGADQMGKDLDAASEAIAAVTGHRPTLLRPPYGSRNPTVDNVSAKLRMAQILWDVDTLDWRYPHPVRIQNAAVASAKRGSIILMHDIHRTTVAAVPHIVEDLRRRGFTLVTVSQLLNDQPAPGQVYRQQSDTARR
jgi:peptidoglycan/xylan/chitin deacetylase (PgdA/CDA1 family)